MRTARCEVKTSKEPHVSPSTVTAARVPLAMLDAVTSFPFAMFCVGGDAWVISSSWVERPKERRKS